NHGRPNRLDLRFQPRPAGGELARGWLGVQPSGTPRRELEMLDRIGQVDFTAIDADLRQSLVQQSTGGPDEWAACQILLVAWLLTNQHQPGVRRALAKNGLRRVLVEMTSLAASCS